MRRKFRFFSLVAALTLVVAACGGDTTETTEAAAPETTEAPAAYVPTAPECVAPSGAGGGWDFTCRTIGLLFEELGLTGNVVVTNQEGGGGAVAFADIAANRNDEDDLTIAASPATAIRFGQNQYTGLEADEFRWIGAIGADFGAFVVTPDSPYQTLDDLVAAMQADPTAITFGGGSPVGGQDHFKLLMFAQEIGVDPAAVPWVAYDGGGEAQVALLGGEIDIAPLDVSEVFGNEDLKVLAVMATDRVEGMDAPTTVELGISMIFPVWRGLWRPVGCPTRPTTSGLTLWVRSKPPTTGRLRGPITVFHRCVCWAPTSKSSHLTLFRPSTTCPYHSVLWPVSSRLSRPMLQLRLSVLPRRVPVVVGTSPVGRLACCLRSWV